MQLRHVIIIIFILLSLFAEYGIWNVTNSYELVVGFFVYSIPTSGLLLVLSIFSRKKDIGWQRMLSITGIITSSILLLISIFFTIYRFIEYYA